MKRIKVRYQGTNYVFEVYATTINRANIFFVKALDKEVKKWLIEDHFFVVASANPLEQYFLNAIKNTREEAEFKGKIADAVLADFFAEGAVAKGSSLN
jgi:hypothetical protein